MGSFPKNACLIPQRYHKGQISYPLILFYILFLPLLGLFIFAIVFELHFFLYLAMGLIACIFYLIPLRSSIIKKQSDIALQIQNCDEQTNLLSVDIQREEKAIESFREKIVNYSQLKGLTERLSLSLTLDDTSRIFSEEVNKLFGSKDTTIIIYLFHSKTGELGISSSQKGQMRINIKAKKGDIYDQWIVRTMQSLLIEDIKNDYRFDAEQVVTQDAREIESLIAVPMVVGNKALGLLRVDSPEKNYFTTEDLRFLTTVGDLGAVAIENAQLYERVEQLAIKDSLTGLYLRRYLLGRMPEEISRQLKHPNQLAFLMLDLDKFKEYNDKFGHVAGDIVLRTVGDLLIKFFKDPGTLVCRYGGEEFSVLLPDCSRQKVLELSEEVRRQISEKTVILRREKTQVTVSIGIATFPHDAQNMQELIHKADLELYRAKENGRNRVCLSQ